MKFLKPHKYLCFAIIMLLHWLLSPGLRAQELTLYVIPPKTSLNWNSPSSILRSYIVSLLKPNGKYKAHPHAMGHIVVELSGTNHHSITGMVSSSRTELGNKLAFEGYGLGVLLSPAKGKLRQGVENTEDIQLRYSDGDVAYIKFKINEATLKRLIQYLTEYKTRGYDSIYNGLNRPREGKGAGCSAFGVSFIELAGITIPDILSSWQVTVNLPQYLIGGPAGNDAWIGVHRILLKHKWANSSQGQYTQVTFYEPQQMFRWIENAWLCESDDTTYTVFREQRGNAKGIVMNCRDFPVPQEPIWKDGVYKADSLVQMLSVLSSQK